MDPLSLGHRIYDCERFLSLMDSRTMFIMKEIKELQDKLEEVIKDIYEEKEMQEAKKDFNRLLNTGRPDPRRDSLDSLVGASTSPLARSWRSKSLGV